MGVERSVVIQVGSYPFPKTMNAVSRASTSHGRYFVVDGKAKRWLEYYTELRDLFVID